MITYPDRGNPGLRRTDNAPASAASGVVENCAARHVAGTKYGKRFPQQEILAATGGQAKTR